MSIIFFNVGWMEKYQGNNPNDQITGGGSYVNKEGSGFEVCNFLPCDDRLYGYVQAPGTQIDIRRIGASSADESIKGVTVAWTATSPSGGTKLIGWYENATVFRHYQPLPVVHPTQKNNNVRHFLTWGYVNQAVLLPIDERTLEIPRQKTGFMGQSNIWYADSPESKGFASTVLAFINGKKSQKKPTASNRSFDQERKVRVEKAAIEACSSHYESLGYSVASVEKDNIGYDLVATSGRTQLKIEVKGLSGSKFCVELTPNEYSAFEKCSYDYRLAVVTNALLEPQLHICRYNHEESKWQVDGDTSGSLEIKTKQSAVISLG